MSWNVLKDKHFEGTSEEIMSKIVTFHDAAKKSKNIEKNLINDKYNDKENILYPELRRSDVSINPSYTGLNLLPYYVVCRRRVYKTKKQMARQFNREIQHMAMMQPYAIASIRIDRNFSIGFPLSAINVPDFATNDERRRINKIMSNR